jgi:hypothetical protein
MNTDRLVIREIATTSRYERQGGMSVVPVHPDLTALVSRRLDELGYEGRRLSYRRAADKATAKGYRISKETVRQIDVGTHSGRISDVATVVRRCKCRTAEQRTSCACPRRDIRWRARHGQGRNEVSRTFASEQEARTWLATVVADQARGLYVDHRDGRRLIKDWAAEWKAAQLHSANTAARVSWAIDVHIAPHFGQLPIGRLTRLRVQTWIRSLEALGYAPETIASLYSVLGSVMAAAVDEGLIPAVAVPTGAATTQRPARTSVHRRDGRAAAR